MAKFSSVIDSKRTLTIWLLVVVPLLGCISLWPILNYAFYGDDWMVLWVYAFQYGTVHAKYAVSSYLCPDGPKFLFMGLLYGGFGLNPLPYFIASMVLRILAAVTIYFFTIGISNNRIAGLLSSAFFAVCYIGLESTSWVFNANTYVAIIFVSFFVYFFYQSRRECSFYLYFTSLAFFTLALSFASPRMSAIFIVVLGDFLWLLRQPVLKKFKIILVRQLPLYLIAYLLKLVGTFGGGNDLSSRVVGGLEYGKNSINQGRFDFLLYPITNMGNIVIPDKVWSSLFSLKLAISFVILVAIFAAMRSLVFKPRDKVLFGFALALVGWMFFLWYMHKIQGASFRGSNVIGPTLIGGVFFIGVIWIYLRYRSVYPELAESIVFSSGWIVSFFVFTWVFAPYLITQSYHRYFTASSVGLSVFIGCACSLLYQALTVSSRKVVTWRKHPILVFQWFFLYLLVGGIFLINMVCSIGFLGGQRDYRGVKPVNEVWESLTKQVSSVKDHAVFYITCDDYELLRGTLDFGFSPHFGIMYGISEYAKNPLLVINFDELVRVMEQGAFIGYGVQKVEIDNLYCFHLENNELINTKPETIQRLNKVLVSEKDSQGNTIWRRR